MTMQYTEKYFEDGHDKLRYFQIGSGNAILFLHGGGVNALTYKKVLDLLSKNYLVIAPDLPCFGKSTCPSNIPDYSKILKKFITSLNFGKIAIVGHSFGGAAALQLSADDKNIQLMVLTDSAGLSQHFSKFRFLYVYFVEKTIRDIFKYRNPKTFLLIVRDFFENIFKRFSEWKFTISVVKRFLLTDFPDFHNVSAKTLILWGEQDEIFPKIFAEKFHRNIENSELKLVDGNHDWCLFNPEKFSNIIIDWLKTNGY